MSGATFSKGGGGLDTVLLQLTAGDAVHECELYLWGATITSWRQGGAERLLVSELAVFDGVKPIRGGIPVVFPQFAQPNPSMPQHGFARTKLWKFIGSVQEGDRVKAWLTLGHDEETLSLWPHEFLLLYEIVLSPTSLITTLHVVNTGDSSFQCQLLLHSYLRVPSIHDIVIRGLQNLEFVDKLQAGAVCEEERHSIEIAQEVDRVYKRGRSSAEYSLTSIDLKSGDKLMDVISSARYVSSKENWSEAVQRAQAADAASLGRLHSTFDYSKQSTPLDVDRVLWNPWIERSRAIVDLNDNAYLQYVCIEPGLVSSAVDVVAKDCLSLRQELSVPTGK